jgi:hypothetical protein
MIAMRMSPHPLISLTSTFLERLQARYSYQSAEQLGSSEGSGSDRQPFETDDHPFRRGRGSSPCSKEQVSAAWPKAPETFPMLSGNRAMNSFQLPVHLLLTFISFRTIKHCTVRSVEISGFVRAELNRPGFAGAPTPEKMEPS